MPPETTLTTLSTFDEELLNTFAAITNIPYEAALSASHMIYRPWRLGGLGLRPTSSVVHQAYWSAAALAAPFTDPIFMHISVLDMMDTIEARQRLICHNFLKDYIEVTTQPNVPLDSKEWRPLPFAYWDLANHYG